MDFEVNNLSGGGKSSKFNAGMLQMQRLHQLQDLINKVRINPLTFNEEYGVFNYQVFFSNLDGLFHETWGKLGDKEKEIGKYFIETLTQMFKKYPIHEETKDKNSQRSQYKLNQKNWEIIRKMLFEFESIIRKYLDTHKFNSPSEEDDGLF